MLCCFTRPVGHFFHLCSTRLNNFNSPQTDREHKLKIIKVFQETISGKSIERPELENALLLAQKKQISIIVDEISRIGRDASEVINLLNTQHFISVEDGLDADEYELHHNAIEAQREGERISRRTKNGLQTAKGKGIQLGNPQIEKAQKLGVAKVQQNADEFALQFEGLLQAMENGSHSFIAKQFNQTNTKTRRGGKWTAQSVKNLRQRVKNIRK